MAGGDKPRSQRLGSLNAIGTIEEDVAVLLRQDSPWALVTRVVANLVSKPNCLAERLNQALLGDPVRILEQDDQWARVQLDRDAYLGWMELAGLLTLDARACQDYLNGRLHLVKSPLASAYAEPAIGAVKVGMLPMGLKVRVNEEQGGFAAIALPDERIWWVGLDHLLPSSSWPWADQSKIDTCLELARDLVGVPYLWGGQYVLRV